MPLATAVGLGPDDIMLHGDPAPLPKMGAEPPPQVSPMSIVVKRTAGWIKMALGMEVGLGPGHIVLDGDPAPLPKRGQSPPIFDPFYCGQTAGCIKMPLGTEVGLGLRDVVRWGPSSPSPNFWAMSTVAKWLDESRCHLVRR